MKISDRVHQKEVKRIQRQLQKCFKEKRKVRVYHGSTNSTRAQNFKKNEIIDISRLNRVLSVNEKEKYAIVEPNVPMDQLVFETLKYNLIPAVVMEFPGITVGGGVQGGAAESSSFKWGAFHNQCFEYEMVLGDGTQVNASEKVKKDLFYGTACSYGSMGIIVAVKLRLIPAKKFVRLTYYATKSYKAAVRLIEQKTKKHVDFIDGILFSKNHGVVMVGTRTDRKEAPLATFTNASDDWFYLHAEKVSKKHKEYTECVPLVDYLFRYDRGGFWVGKYAFRKTRMPFNRVTRFILNPLFKTRTLYRFLHAINISQRQIVQDIALPKTKAEAFIEFAVQKTRVFPIWLCPLRPDTREKLSPARIITDLIIDVGVWGKVKGTTDEILKLNREIERITERFHGRKILYAHAYYPENEFWKIYDKKWYDSLRKKYHADMTFPTVYEKTKVKERYSYSVLKGLIDVFSSPFKLPVS